jgi:hypothetical protein
MARRRSRIQRRNNHHNRTKAFQEKQKWSQNSDVCECNYIQEDKLKTRIGETFIQEAFRYMAFHLKKHEGGKNRKINSTKKH